DSHGPLRLFIPFGRGLHEANELAQRALAEVLRLVDEEGVELGDDLALLEGAGEPLVVPSLACEVGSEPGEQIAGVRELEAWIGKAYAELLRGVVEGAA